MPHGRIILDKPLSGVVNKGAVVAALALAGCGFLPRTSTGDDLLDAVLIREDPFGDCVTVSGRTAIFKEVGGPNEPPGLLKVERFEDMGARTAAAAIAVSYRDYVWGNLDLIHIGAGDAETCVMDLSRPAYSGEFAFVDFSDPGGETGVYVLRKSGSRWSVIEKHSLGAW